MIRTPRPLMAGAEPFEHEGAPDIGALLVHGFTGTPNEMRPIATALSSAGFGSIGPLLHGHGTHPDDMAGVSFARWQADVDAAYDRLLALHERVVVIGLSMGGTLALNLAARRSHDPRLAGLVTINTPLRLDDWRLGFAGIISMLAKWQSWGKPDIKDRTAWDKHLSYGRFRTGSVLELLALLDETRTLLPLVHQPILVARAAEDHVVPPRNAEIIHAGVSSTDKRLLVLDNCYHVATVDFAASQLNDEIVQFVERVGRSGSDGADASATDPI